MSIKRTKFISNIKKTAKKRRKTDEWQFAGCLQIQTGVNICERFTTAGSDSLYVAHIPRSVKLAFSALLTQSTLTRVSITT